MAERIAVRFAIEQELLSNKEMLSQGRPTVIKIGSAEDAGEVLRHIGFLVNEVGARVAVVHGGGKEIDKALEARGITPRKIDGLRVTDEETLRIVVDVLDRKNRELVDSLRRIKVNAVPYDSTSHIIRGVQEDERLGFVGKVICVDTRMVEEDIENKRVSVISPVGVVVNSNSQHLNNNGDRAAGAIAQVLGANLVLVTAVGGVLDSKGKLIREISDSRFQMMQQEGSITDGMIPKLKAACQVAVSGGKATICGTSDLLHVVFGYSRGTVFNTQN